MRTAVVAGLHHAFSWFCCSSKDERNRCLVEGWTFMGVTIASLISALMFTVSRQSGDSLSLVKGAFANQVESSFLDGVAVRVAVLVVSGIAAIYGLTWVRRYRDARRQGDERYCPAGIPAPEAVMPAASDVAPARVVPAEASVPVVVLAAALAAGPAPAAAAVSEAGPAPAAAAVSEAGPAPAALRHLAALRQHGHRHDRAHW